MLDKLVKVMAVIGALSLFVLLVAAASITVIGNNVDVSGSLTVSNGATITGNLAADSLTVNGVTYAHVPRGVIVAFNGDTAPAGWAICDGSNGTPDLRDRFLVGSGRDYNRGATGGEAMHTLTIAEMPSHVHNLEDYTFSEHYAGAPGVWGSGDSDYDNGPANPYAHDTYATGGNQAHENRPPYYALTYIMKL